MKSLLKIFLTVALFLGFAQAKDSRYAASFLELGVGARALAMGGAQVALSDDATGFYWNPAGLALLPGIQAASMYANLFNTLEQQSYLSAAMPIFGGASISIAWIRLSIDDIPRYAFDENGINAYQRIVTFKAPPLTAEPSSYFSSNDNAFIISFAKYLPWKMDLGWQYFEVPVQMGFGMNLKMIDQSLDESSGSAVGLDAGFIFRIALNDIFVDSYYGDLSFGINVQDLTGTQITWNTDSKHKDKIGRNFKYGLSYKQPLQLIRSQLTFAYDIDSKFDGSTHLGSEFLYNSILAVRLGTNSGFFTTGAGIVIWKFHFDYAYQSHDLGNSHRVSVLMKF